MDVNSILKQLIAVTINLKAGLRLATGQKVARNNFVYSIDQGFWLLALLLCLEIIIPYLAAEKPALFSTYGLNYLGATYLFDLLILMLMARLARADSTDTGRLLLAFLASMPLITVVFHLFTLPEQLYYNHPVGGGSLLLLLLIWHLFIVFRLLRIILMEAFSKAAYLAVLSLLLSISSSWILPYSLLWYSDEPTQSENTYSKLNDLINPATKYVVFSRSVPACGKASKRRCSTSTASFDNAVCRQAHFGLSFKKSYC
ncbi:MAG: hypothetical protein ABW124_22415 [Candidatus Thiodiazotropha sp. 6PLUC9]